MDATKKDALTVPAASVAEKLTRLNESILPDPKKHGAALVDLAIEKRRATLQFNLMQYVENLLRARSDQSTHIESCNRRLEIIDRQIAAINAGEITVNEFGQVTYNEADLNIDTVAVL